MNPMMKVLFSALVLLQPLAAPALADFVIPPANLFRDPKFVAEFVGSYGILSDVEPRVSADEQAVLAEIRELFEQSKFDAAEQRLTAFIREVRQPSDPEKEPGEVSPSMIFVLGNLYFQANRPDEARRAFLEAIRRFPRFRRAHANLGYLHISRNQPAEALPMLQKAVELGESSARAFGLIGYCHLLGKHPVAAENAYRQACLLDAESRDWNLGLAQALMAQEKNAEAASLIGTLIQRNPNDRQLWLQQTNALLAQEKKDDAIVNLETMRLKGIADEANLNLLGNLYIDRSQPQLALLAYLAGMERSQMVNVPRTLRSARILVDYGYPEKADALLRGLRNKAGEALAEADRKPLLLAEVRVAQSMKDTGRTSTLLDELKSLAPADGDVLLETARHHDAMARAAQDDAKREEHLNEARTHYQLALRNDNVAYPANLSLGQMLVRERRYGEALPHLRNALNLRKSESLEQYVSRVQRAADRLDDKAG
ncbi:MAG: tetratricopeptide repeat protein [Verrucomicrobia bacterium]|nr:tetratricopeptide repeat protein [Verrucomicrobiota bacterium]